MRKKIISDIEREVSPDTTISDFCDDKEYSVAQVLYRFDTWTNAKDEAGVDTHAITCPNCESLSAYISNHWNSCGEPQLSEKQKSMLLGMFLSDGTVNERGAFTAYSSNKEFLSWLSEELDFIAYPVVFNDSGDERHRRNINSGFDEDRNANYRDMYAMSSPIHTFTRELREYYMNGEKRLHDSLNIDKNVLKLWYCGDGGLNWSKDERAYAEIRPLSFENESIMNIFSGLEYDYSIQNDGTVCFYGDTEKFLETIGPAPKGMEYKWETDSRYRYKRLKP